MYYTHFGLIQPPYKITPDTGAFFCGADRGEILDALVFAIKNGEGLTKVVGEVGSGKTMLCRMLQVALPKNIEIAYLSNPNLSPENVLPAIALELGLPIHPEDAANRLHVLKALEKYLLDKHSNNQQVVVLVEEAQGMPLASLEEIRLLSNLETRKQKLLQIVLFGQPELDENLSAPHVRQIKDRITHSLYLPPIKLDDIREYLMFRLRNAGYSGPTLFSKGAVWLISRFSNGLLRRINILADKSLLAAYAHNAKKITWNHVLAARRDSEFSHRGGNLSLRVILGLLLGISLGIGVSYSTISYLTTSKIATLPVITPNTTNADVVDNNQTKGQMNLQINLPIPPAATDIEVPDSTGSVDYQPNSLLAQRLEATNNWLASTSSGNFSIQILLANSDSTTAIEQFLAQPSITPLLQQIFVYESKLRNAAVLNVLYGRFASFSEASKVLKTLPDTVKQSQPYIRNIRDFRASNEQTTYAKLS